MSLIIILVLFALMMQQFMKIKSSQNTSLSDKDALAKKGKQGIFILWRIIKTLFFIVITIIIFPAIICFGILTGPLLIIIIPVGLYYGYEFIKYMWSV